MDIGSLFSHFHYQAGTIVAIALIVLLSSPASSPAPPLDQGSIQVEAKPVTYFDPGNPSRSRFGSLEFRGGLVLSSSYKRFGGISGLRTQPDGKSFIGLSDRGYWIRGRIVYDSNRPARISETSMAPVLGPRNVPRSRLDTESLAGDSGILFVGVEGLDAILRFDYGKKGFLARGQRIAVPPELKDLPDNKGLEAMVFVPRHLPLGGTLIALSERALTPSGDLKAFLIGGRHAGTFSVKRSADYDISDAALLPGGDLLILERKLSLFRGFSVRIRRIRLTDIKPGAVVDGPTLIEAGMDCEIDNMEALSVSRGPEGETVLTLMSDDNFSAIQRTLLLQFILRSLS